MSGETTTGGGTLYARLAAAQADMANPAFDKVNPHFRNSFASLAAIRNATVPALAAHGLACVQVVEGGRVVTRVYGPDGDSIDLAGVPVTLGGTPQANGSELTYAKRYSLSAAFCVVGDDDDDGEAATAHWQQQRARQAPPPPARQRPMSEGIRAELTALAAATAEETGMPEADVRRAVWDACKDGADETAMRALAAEEAQRLVAGRRPSAQGAGDVVG